MAISKEVSQELLDLGHEFQAKCGGYWGENPDWPVSEWMAEVETSCTRLGYWEWVAAQDQQSQDQII